MASLVIRGRGSLPFKYWDFGSAGLDRAGDLPGGTWGTENVSRIPTVGIAPRLLLRTSNSTAGNSRGRGGIRVGFGC